MQTAYTPPPQKAVEASVFTSAGWMRGAFLVPALRIFAEYLNHQQEFLKVRNAILPGVDHPLPFFALRRDSIIFMVPSGEDMIVSPEGRQPRSADISCAFNSGAISGTLHLPQGVRVSDFLLQKAHFFPLFRCTAYIRSGSHLKATPDLQIALVNARNVIGVSEPPFTTPGGSDAIHDDDRGFSRS